MIFLTDTDIIFYDFSNRYRYRYTDTNISVSLKSIGLSLWDANPEVQGSIPGGCTFISIRFKTFI